MKATFCVFKRGGYAVMQATSGLVQPIHQASDAVQRVRLALDVMARNPAAVIAPVLLWFIDDARAALDEVQLALRQEAA